MLTYSLIAHCPYEGWRASINGVDGRMEVQEFHSGQNAADPNHAIRIFNRQGELTTYSVPKKEGTHGGSDARLQADLFRDGDLPDPLNHRAGTRDGAMSIMIGIAANVSIGSGQPVNIKDLLGE